ncbi:MAG: hypothetical protein IJO27_00020 [Bacilli bacterium]|nr:hypothetical protein [Bacilli bacterium]
MNQFLIPANSKKSMLIFGTFRPIDLIILGCGIGATLLMLITLPINNGLPILIIALLPLLVTGLLVFPVANYHNTLTVLVTIYQFYTSRQKFIWKGWCASHGTKESNTNKK